MIVKYCYNYNAVRYLVLCDEHVAILMIFTVISSAVGQSIYIYIQHIYFINFISWLQTILTTI